MAISVTKYMVKDDLSAIELIVQVSSGQTVSEILLWDEGSYKNPGSAVDLTNLITGTGNSESITITSSDAGVTRFDGMYFLQVISSNAEAVIVATFNMTQYYVIQAKLIANIDLSCLNCSSNFQNSLLFDMYLEATKQALLIGRYQDAIDNLANLIITVDTSYCEECGDIEPAISSAGNIVSVGVIDCLITQG